ncbi:MAG: FHA domain-containing protein [Leucobacter sp.]|nr:FHA domain-containing protein [Leucobacter sp.]
MSDLTLLILRIGFLLLLWLFIFAIVYALRSDLFGAPVRRLPAGGAGPNGGAGSPDARPTEPGAGAPVITPSGGALPSAGAAQARQLVITSGVAAGTSVPLDVDTLTIGRSSDSSLVIVDEYTSTYHAKLSRNGDQWMLTDLDSTNGTKLNGTRVSGTVLVPPFTPITIGTTTFELRP